MSHTIILWTISLVSGCGSIPGGIYSRDAHTTLHQKAFGRIPQNPIPIADSALAQDPRYSTVLALSPGGPTGPFVWAILDTESTGTTLAENRESLAWQYVHTKAEILGIRADDLVRPVRVIESSPVLSSVTFQRAFAGVTVRDGYVKVVFAQDSSNKWRPREIISSLAGEIQVPNASEAAPTHKEMLSILGMAENSSVEVESENNVILATTEKCAQYSHFSQDSDCGDPTFTMATEFVVTIDASSIRHITLEHGTKNVLENYEGTFQFKNTRVMAKAYDGSYLRNKQVSRALSLTPLATPGIKTNTDDRGVAALDSDDIAGLKLDSWRLKLIVHPSTTPLFIPAKQKDNSNKEKENFSVSKADDGSLVINPSTESMYAINTYANLLDVNSFVRRHVNPKQLPILDDQTPTVVINADLKNGACNGEYLSNLNQIRLSRAGASCPDMTLVSEIAVHEWGHGLDHFSGTNPGIKDQTYSESIGDILAAYWQKSPEIGLGFNSQSTAAQRNIQNQLVLPKDLKNDIHEDSKIISGAFWDLRQSLIKKYGELRGSWHAEKIFLRHVLDTDKYQDAYMSVSRLDDDDANSRTRSPNFCLINNAFAKHGLAEKEECNDPEPTLNWNQDLSLAIKSDEGGKVVLFASMSESKTERIGVCIVTSPRIYSQDPTDEENQQFSNCLFKGQWHQMLSLIGTNDGRSIYEGQDPIQVGSHQRVILVALSGTKKPFNAREFRFQ